jgi:outer membrane protein assembly factor BamB
MMMRLLFLSLLIAPLAARNGPEWFQWGGPDRNFTIPKLELAETWPDEGPPELWRRSLGPGYSGIVTDAKRLYTMYRKGDQAFFIALDRATGETVWEYGFESKPYPNHVLDFGTGPNGSPLLIDGKLIGVGFSNKLFCLNAEDGSLLWSHDLVRDLGGEVVKFGYAAAPLAYRDWVIVLVGGKSGVVALNRKDGSVAWKSPPLDISYGSAAVVTIEGRDQIVFFGAEKVRGISADNGALLWEDDCAHQYKNNAGTPIALPGNRVWASSQRKAATRVLDLSYDGDKATAKRAWHNGKVRVFFWNSAPDGDVIYGAFGNSGEFMGAVDTRTGEFLWRQRSGFERANVVRSGDKLIILDQKGFLGLAQITPEKYELLSKASISTADKCWTPPTVVGTTLYYRDTQEIAALDLSKR